MCTKRYLEDAIPPICVLLIGPIRKDHPGRRRDLRACPRIR